ncbi:MAG: hypothetical protein ACRYFS_02410 [Janthinobacterium lividum]
MSTYVVYDTLLGNDAVRCRKIRVDKYVTLEDAKRSAQLRFIRFSRGPQPGETTSVDRVTVETNEGEIVYELPSVPRH